MSRKTLKAADEQIVIAKCCGNCTKWKQLGTGDGSWGSCLNAAKFMATPPLRSDLDSCSKYEAAAL